MPPLSSPPSPCPRVVGPKESSTGCRSRQESDEAASSLSPTIGAPSALGDGDLFTAEQIKSKYATLRFYWGGRLSSEAEAKVEEAIDLAEARSACTCETCGALGRLYSGGGWLATACPEHAQGERAPVKPGCENLHIVRKLVEGGIRIVSCRRYDRDVDPHSLRLWILSDLHIELTQGWDLPSGAGRPDFDVMVVAGDLIPRMERGVKWLSQHVPDRPVLYIAGNHELYGADADRTVEKAQEAAAGTFVHVIQNETVRVGNVTFAGRPSGPTSRCWETSVARWPSPAPG